MMLEASTDSKGTNSAMTTSHNPTRRPDYRIGDFVIKRELFSDSETTEYQKHYPDSIGASYLNATKRRRQYSLLADLVEQWEAKRICEKPTDTTLSVHLRLGDRITQTKLPTAAEIAGIANRILQRHAEIDRIVLLYGNHITGPAAMQEQSLDYLATLEDLLSPLGNQRKQQIELKKRIDMNPDEDFVYLINSKYCVLTIGGFSALAGILSARRGGGIHSSSLRGPAHLTAQLIYSRWLGRSRWRSAA